MRKVDLLVSVSKGALPVLLAVTVAPLAMTQLNLRGMTLITRRDGPQVTNVLAGWSVAAGS